MVKEIPNITMKLRNTRTFGNILIFLTGLLIFLTQLRRKDITLITTITINTIFVTLVYNSGFDTCIEV